MAGKVTFDRVRKIAVQFPGLEASTSYGAPSWRIDGQMVACKAVNKSAEPNSLVVRIDFDQRDALIAEAPDTFYITDHYVNYPSVLVRLSHINDDVLRDLLGAALKFVSSRNKKKGSKPAAKGSKKRA
ncbi:MAG TPA: MmcQ/YjbR family DNA-binding protein [Terriglobia bacterium]|nr:MmcQ/YjbR family DNA-binding protein [Terriglobia bacterium]